MLKKIILFCVVLAALVITIFMLVASHGIKSSKPIFTDDSNFSIKPDLDLPSPIVGKTSSGYKYIYQRVDVDCRQGPDKCESHLEDNIKCDPPPVLKFSEVAEIAEQAHLNKPPNGSWSIEYISREGRAGNPFSDHCIWTVETAEPSYALDAGAMMGRSYLLITDTSKQFYAPHICSYGWCKPQPGEIGTAH